jgi:hypothetical protein
MEPPNPDAVTMGLPTGVRNGRSRFDTALHREQRGFMKGALLPAPVQARAPSEEAGGGRGILPDRWCQPLLQVQVQVQVQFRGSQGGVEDQRRDGGVAALGVPCSPFPQPHVPISGAAPQTFVPRSPRQPLPCSKVMEAGRRRET